MTVIAFDTLAYANKLKGAGMDARLADIQSEETAKILGDLATNQLASKDDLNLLKVDMGLMKNDMSLVKNDMKLLRGDVNLLKIDLVNVKTELMKEIHMQTWKIIGLFAGLQAVFHFIK